MNSARFALIGDPVSASPSPRMHRAAFESAGLPHEYLAVRVPEGGLDEAWPALRATFRGLNVTIPHKERVVELLDSLGGEAAASRSVNTVVFEEERAVGHSTDGQGFLDALHRAGMGIVRRAVVLGAGGAARAATAALRTAGAEVSVANRSPRRARRLVAELHVELLTPSPEAFSAALSGADLLVNATPVGTGDPDASPLPAEVPLHPGLTVFDLVYRPRRTRLLRRAEAEGCRTVEGIEMLVAQGARSFELWTGRPAPLEAMRAAAEEALDAVPGTAGRDR